MSSVFIRGSVDFSRLADHVLDVRADLRVIGERNQQIAATDQGAVILRVDGREGEEVDIGAHLEVLVDVTEGYASDESPTPCLNIWRGSEGRSKLM